MSILGSDDAAAGLRELEEILAKVPDAAISPGGYGSRIFAGGAKPPPPASFTNARAAEYAYRLIREYSKRCKEALSLYVPLPAVEAFHASRCKKRLLTGANRSSKTTGAIFELARAVCGRDPHGKFPLHNGRALIVGKDQDHLGQVLARKLFGLGAFQMVKDPKTGLWRSVRPDPENPSEIDPIDKELKRQGLWKPSGPPIPPRLIKRIAWDNKSKNVPRIVYMRNGWEILWRSGGGDPPQGIDLDFALLDEEIDNEQFVSETIARLLDRDGCLVWSATPQNFTSQMLALHDQAERGEGVEEFQVLIADNPYIDKQVKADFLRDLLAISEEEAQVRFFGAYAIVGLRVYPEFAPNFNHGCKSFEIPSHWTRYLILDPGFQFCATLFAAVPPDGSEVHVYDESFVKRSDVSKWADAVAPKIRAAGCQFEDFIADFRMGRQSQQTSGRPLIEHYSEELEKRDISSRRSQFTFTPGCDDIDARTAALKEWMKPNDEGRCKLQVHRDKCPNLLREMRAQVYRKDRPDVRVDRDNHLVSTLEYLAAYDPGYRKPVLLEEDGKPAEDILSLLKAKRKRIARQERGGLSPLGSLVFVGSGF